MCSQNQLLGGTSVSEVSEGLRAGARVGLWVTALVPGAGCWGAGLSTCISPNPGVCGGVCVYSLANFKLELAGKYGGLRFGLGYQAGKSLCWYAQGDLPVWSACGKSMSVC